MTPVADANQGDAHPRTIVAFHAHPDDETIITGGTLARAADEGHRVVLVFATRGEVGEVDDGVLASGESLAERREAEAHDAADILGITRVAFLGYRDSGMADSDTLDHPDAFSSADVDEVAGRLAALLRDEHADVLIIYDDHGGYGHPDHIQVHRVGVRAAELAALGRVYAATMNRDKILELVREARESLPEGAEPPEIDEAQFGVPADEITTTVDVGGALDRKRAAMAAHATQIPADSFFLAMPDDVFARSFGEEWFIRLDSVPDEPEVWIL
jgi:LmbE family N-acetylglucosaminyl deacetylase